MSYDSKIQAVRKIIEDSNSTFTKEDPGYVDFDKFLENIRRLGATTEATLKGLTYDDLQQECGLNIALARTVAFEFRQKGSNRSSVSGYISERKANMLSHRELFERYDPKDSKNPVGKRLRELSEGKACVVFNKDNRVNVDESVKLLNDLRDGHDELITTFVEGVPTPVYKIGDRPDFFLDENPLYHGEALRSGEKCSHTGQSWTNIPLEIRQLMYLAVRNGEIDAETTGQIIDVIDKARNSKMEQLRARYPLASLEFDSLAKTGQLPTLKVQVGNGVGTGRDHNNPFGSNLTS